MSAGRWNSVRVGDLGRIVTGRTPTSGRPACFGQEYPFITPTDMDGRRYIDRTERYLSDEGAKLLASCTIPKNSVCVSCIGWQLGKVVLATAASFTNQQINSVIPYEIVDPLFLYYSLSTRRDEIRRLGSSGARTPILNKSEFSRMNFDLPPLETQRQIASILSAYDDLIENNTRRIAILEEMARALYQEWFVHFRFPGHEHVPLAASPLGPIPEGWEVRAASEVLEVNPKIRSDKKALKAFVPMSGLSDHSMLVSGVQIKKTNSGARFQNGDTLLARITPCLENGKTGYVDFLPLDSDVAHGSTEFIVLRGRAVCHEFVYFLARSDGFRDHAIKSMSGATGRQRVRNECFNTFYLAEPDQETMARFGIIVEPMFQAVLLFAKKNENLRATRDLLLPKLISGEIAVSALPEEPIAEAAD